MSDRKENERYELRIVRKRRKQTAAQTDGQPDTYWFPNSDDTNRKPVFRTHMAVATGIVSKYFSRISVTLKITQTSSGHNINKNI